MKIADFFKNLWKNYFEKRKIEKIECTVIINTFPQHVVGDSSRFTKGNLPTTGTQTYQNIFKIFIEWTAGGHDLEAAAADGVPDHGFIWNFRKLPKFARPQHPHNQKLCGKRRISIQNHPTKKNMFFAENVFSQYFSLFSTPQHLDFRDFADLGMCPYLDLGCFWLPASSVMG